MKNEDAKISKSNKNLTAKDCIDYIFDNFIELHGDRLLGDDISIISGIGLLDNNPVTVIGQMRGKNNNEYAKYNFSMTYPEGFRKALRLMKQAEKFGRPIVCFVDTIGAYLGEEAEQRGQVSAIANNISTMMFLKVPIITILIGNGVSGGALALCIADKIFILENAMFAVISPKACAEILWKDTGKVEEAKMLLKMDSINLKAQGIVDYIFSESNSGIPIEIDEVVYTIKNYLIKELMLLKKMSKTKLIKKRKMKFRNIGKRNQIN